MTQVNVERNRKNTPTYQGEKYTHKFLIIIQETEKKVTQKITKIKKFKRIRYLDCD